MWCRDGLVERCVLFTTLIERFFTILIFIQYINRTNRIELRIRSYITKLNRFNILYSNIDWYIVLQKVNLNRFRKIDFSLILPEKGIFYLFKKGGFVWSGPNLSQTFETKNATSEAVQKMNLQFDASWLVNCCLLLMERCVRSVTFTQLI